MKAFFTNKIVIAVAAVLLTAGLATGGFFIARAVKNKNNPGGPTPVPTGAQNGVYYEVKFANLEGTGEREIEKTRLPETSMVESGTKISLLTTPTRQNSVFLGWSYDAKGTKLVGGDDVVNANMTLYPRFGVKEGMDGTFHLNYVALKDTKLKRPVVVAGMELTEEAVRELITLRNSSLDEEVPFKLVLKEEDPINVDYS
ncbi:MAG: InlB B-repeat-containing protein, partial [Lachnospiraceae bacterium]|nr:InlB B-repeat-containing protein [Lachnospiraceae bacterium]